MKTLICNCNRTMPLDGAALTKALGTQAADGLQTVHTTLCRRDAPAFQRAARSGEELVVACTQEARLFVELAEQTEGAPSLAERPIRFVNIRESGGWSKDARSAMPKLAALIAAAQTPEPEPVPTVAYTSRGRCLVIGPAEGAERAATMLGASLDCTLLIDGGGSIAQGHEREVHVGTLQSLKGWLGAFEARWRNHNPIDLDLCTRCNACIAACPEGAIDFGYQIDMAACKSHRDCVRVCEAAGAIDFERAPRDSNGRFDLVLDLRDTPAFSQHALPQGYLHAGLKGGEGERRLADAVLALRDMVGTFDKPRFVSYQPKLCAHSRNEKIGCTACLDVCSASAITSDASLKGKAPARVRTPTPATPVAGGLGGGIVVHAHLCVGCGACSTVCPSGALTYAAPNPVDHGRLLRALLGTYARAGGRDAAVLLHSRGAGARRIEELGRMASIDRDTHGVPARVLPLAVHHTASVGIDLWLSAIAYGASQVWLLLTEEEAPEYRQALTEQAAVAQAILSGLGYAGTHVRLIEVRDARDLASLDAALRAAPAQGTARAATFAAQADKRATLDLALDHLMSQAPSKASATALATSAATASPASSPNGQGLPESIALPAAGSPFGSLQINAQACTLCLACVGACPESALADNPERPQLRFIEKNCVQCGLCATTCPESAITLEPRLWLAEGGAARKRLRVLNESQPYACIRCGKAFGTLQAIEAMVGKLAGHAMFQGRAADRLRMCGDCRVIDIHTDANEVRITDV